MILARIFYVWHLFAKVISYFTFGVCSVLFSSVGFPIILILSGFSKQRFCKIARAVIFIFFKAFVWEMRLLGILTLHVEHRERLKNIEPSVIVANHPSFLDIVILFSLIPKVTCIVKGSLADTPFVRHIVRPLYIPNSIPFEAQLKRVQESLAHGEPLVIFPEGTRTVPGEPMTFKKGAARFALFSGRPVQPIYIGGNQKVGLRKSDLFFSFHPTERYHYNLEILEPISVEKFRGHSPAAQAAYLTEEMRSVLEERRSADPEISR